MGLRLRPMHKLLEDPNFTLQVGRLVGASEMAAVLLQVGKLSAQELGDVGVRLGKVTNYFLEKDSQIEVDS